MPASLASAVPGRGEVAARPGHPGVVAALTVLVGLLLAGCQSNPVPPPIEAAESSSVPPPTASATPKPPTMPAKARARSRAGAKAFVRHYIELLNYAMATGNTDSLEAVAARDCKSCAGVINRIRKVYDAGGHLEGGKWNAWVISPVPGQPLKSPMFDVGIRMSAQHVVRRKGAERRWFKGGKLPTTFLLTRQDGRWVVEDWERAA